MSYLEFDEEKLAQGYGIDKKYLHFITDDSRAMSSIIELKLLFKYDLKKYPSNSPVGDLHNPRNGETYEVRTVSKHGTHLGYSSKKRNGYLGADYQRKFWLISAFIFVDITRFPKCPIFAVGTDTIREFWIDADNLNRNLCVALDGKISYNNFEYLTELLEEHDFAIID